MRKHGLYMKDLEHMIANPSKCSWTLNKPATTDLHDLLHKKRIPLEEIGMIYRAIDPDLCQKTAGNKDAYSYVSKGFLFNLVILRKSVHLLMSLRRKAIWT